MLADVVCLIFSLMAGLLGWKRRAKKESISLFFTIISYGLARFSAPFVSTPFVSLVGLGPVDAQLIFFLILWVFFFFLFSSGWTFLKKRDTSGVRISIDEHGNPVVSGQKIKSVLGFFLGFFRGSVLYIGIVACMTALVPSQLYKDGRGTAMIHPTSKTMVWIRRFDPLLQRMERITRGLRSLRYLQLHPRRRSKAFASKKAKAIWLMPACKRLRREARYLLQRADHRRQGRRDPTLLLWHPTFQQLVVDQKVGSALIQLGQLVVAPFDRQKIKDAKGA